MFFEHAFFAQIMLESLPISSSTHLRLLGLSAPWLLDFCAHGPTALMLIGFTAPDWWYWVRTVTRTWRTSLYFIVLLALSELLTAFLFGLKYVVFKVPDMPATAGLALTALLLLSLLWRPRATRTAIGVHEAIVLGVTQGLTCFLGFSRLASTIAVGRWCGLSNRTAFLYSLALQIPLFGAGALLGCWKLWGAQQAVFSLGAGSLVLATLACMVVAYFLLWGVQRMVESDKLWLFGVYVGTLALLLTFLPIS